MFVKITLHLSKGRFFSLPYEMTSHFFLAHFVTKMLIKCSINPKKSHYHPKKSKKSKKVKKSKKFFFIFHILCEKKSHLYIYFLNFGPLPHLKNTYYENIKFFQKNKIFIKSTQKSVNLSPSCGVLVFVPQLYHICDTCGT